MERNRSSSRLKQRLARLFIKPSSLLRSTCNTSSSAATVISSTASSRTLLRDVAREPVFLPRRHRRRLVDDDDDMFSAHDSLGRCLSFSVTNNSRHVAPVLMPFSVDCGGCRPTGGIPPLMANSEKGRHGKNRKKERRVRETGGFYETGEGEGRMCPPTSPSSLSKSSYYHYYCFNEVEKEDKREEKNEKKQKKKKKKKKKKLLSNSYGFSSSSSVDSDDEFEFFTSEEREGKEEETETFFSSRSFSSDSTEFYQRPLPNANKKKNTKRPSRYPPRRRSRNREDRNHASERFQPLVSVAPREKKVRELEEEKRGFAVVKTSSDPYGDFRSSMLEMIMERQIFGHEDLEKLLHTYLSLNSPHHHPCILQAFSDIWVVLFGN